jgi:hypothetical protein
MEPTLVSDQFTRAGGSAHAPSSKVAATPSRNYLWEDLRRKIFRAGSLKPVCALAANFELGNYGQ